MPISRCSTSCGISWVACRRRWPKRTVNACAMPGMNSRSLPCKIRCSRTKTANPSRTRRLRFCLAWCFRRRRYEAILSDNEPYPFESDDDIEIRELDLEDVDALGDKRITVSELAGENESWRYGHVIVDEAQDLTPMQWRMVMRRVRGRSLTIVGDLAQRSASAVDRWEDVLPPELADAHRQDLTVNYRSPSE
ncbi:MAG: UvrD-helicase domain-containing protein, partial [Acidimicrobiaceae bacterium]|nr:UvrD-helicase domain-containing protein [Acidimicrobiaceae bacterium]